MHFGSAMGSGVDHRRHRSRTSRRAHDKATQNTLNSTAPQQLRKCSFRGAESVKQYTILLAEGRLAVSRPVGIKRPGPQVVHTQPIIQDERC